MLRPVLLADGSSDAALVPILDWLISRRFQGPRQELQFADLRTVRKPPKSLRERIEHVVRLYGPDLLFVHRDAEREPWESRVAEIRSAASEAGASPVPVVPVRMTESWLLFDESAIRHAANNPRGTRKIRLPNLSRLESLPDPKELLLCALRDASELSRRRVTDRDLHRFRLRVAHHIEDFTPLLKLGAFRQLVAELHAVLPPLEQGL